jgi:hypothetical protein
MPRGLQVCVFPFIASLHVSAGGKIEALRAPTMPFGVAKNTIEHIYGRAFRVFMCLLISCACVVNHVRIVVVWRPSAVNLSSNVLIPRLAVCSRRRNATNQREVRV